VSPVMDHLVPHGRCHCCAFLASGRFRRSLILKACVLIGFPHSPEMTAVSQPKDTTRTLHHCSLAPHPLSVDRFIKQKVHFLLSFDSRNRLCSEFDRLNLRTHVRCYEVLHKVRVIFNTQFIT
jgi:hypothetical protein